MKTFPIGIQLYTVRTLLEGDFPGTLRALAQMGYQGVEFAGNYGCLSPKALADVLKTLNLQCCGLHVALDEIGNPNSDTYTYAKALNSSYLSTSLCGEVAKDWQTTIQNVIQAAPVATQAGMTFVYHNHAHEFARINGVYALDLLYEKTDPAHVKAELDTFWIRKGGEDPAAYIRKYAGRVPLVHLKDMTPKKQQFAEVGEGCLDIRDILAASEEAGSKWIIIEQDECKGSPLESAKISFENMKKIGCV